MNEFEQPDEFRILKESIVSTLSRFDERYWREHDRKAEFPEEFFSQLAKSGFFSLNVPEQYGGAGLGLRAVSFAIKEVSRLCGMSAGDIIMAVNVFGVQTVKSFANEDIKERILPELSSGRHVVSFAITEPEAGVNTPEIATEAVERGDGFIIRGRKIWITLAHKASLIFLLARTKPLKKVEKKTDGLTLFMIERDKIRENSLAVSRIEDIAMRPLGSCELDFEDMYIPKENVIGEVDRAWLILPQILNAERISTASIGTGLGELLISKASDYARVRKTFSKPIASNQGIQFPLARAYAEVQTAWSVTQRAAWEFDSSIDCSINANVAAFLASRAAYFAADRAMQTFGGMAYAVDSDIERHWRDSRLLRTGPVPEEMVLSFVGQRVLKLPRSY
jgi:acyl-CoA dehydrogenase